MHIWLTMIFKMKSMKRLTTILFCLMMVISVSAQEQRKFSPEKFQADLEAYITREAHFDQQEAAKYFPLLREMQAKQRAIYARMYKKEKPSGDAKCAEAIANYDKANIELKQLDQTYHKKMMKVVPASKVFDAMRAENDFHRNMMKGMGSSTGSNREDVLMVPSTVLMVVSSGANVAKPTSFTMRFARRTDVTSMQ